MPDNVPMRRKRGWMNLKVTKIVNETYDTDTFYLEDADEGGRPFDYVAGQYLTFRFDSVGPKPLVRSYTMSSSPVQDGFSAVTVKRVEQGVISNWLCSTVKEGDILRARGPIGKFVFDENTDHQNLTMVAGGSGVTPFVSIMREYVGRLDSAKDQSMTLLVSFRSRQDLICWDELQRINQAAGMRVITTLTRENVAEEGFLNGRINAAMLEEITAETYATTTFMTCGPDAIMNLTVGFLRDKGVEEQHIKQESFES